MPKERQLCVSNINVGHILIYGSGGSAISPDERLIAISDLADGFVCYSLSDQQKIYKINLNTSESVPTSVIFGPNGSLFLGGSSAYVAGGMPPAIKQHLKYEGKGSIYIKDPGR